MLGNFGIGIECNTDIFFRCESETKKYHFDVIQTLQNKMTVVMIHIASCYNLIFCTLPINSTPEI